LQVEKSKPFQLLNQKQSYTPYTYMRVVN